MGITRGGYDGSKPESTSILMCGVADLRDDYENVGIGLGRTGTSPNLR